MYARRLFEKFDNNNKGRPSSQRKGPGHQGQARRADVIREIQFLVVDPASNFKDGSEGKARMVRRWAEDLSKWATTVGDVLVLGL